MAENTNPTTALPHSSPMPANRILRRAACCLRGGAAALALLLSGPELAAAGSVQGISFGLDIQFADFELADFGQADFDELRFLVEDDAAAALQAAGLLPPILTEEKLASLAELQALFRISEFFTAIGVADEQEVAAGFVRELRSIIASDPFVSFTLDYENTSDETQTIALRASMPITAIEGATLARNFLEVELIDADVDGTASIGHSFQLGGRLQEGLADQPSTSLTFQIGSATLGDEIEIAGGQTVIRNGSGQVVDTLATDMPGPVVFDSGVVAGPTATQADPFTQMFTTTLLELSGGDRLRLRGYVALSETAELLPELEAVLGALDALSTAACGDANRDGLLTATDALIALATAVDAATCPLLVCDTDDSGDVTASDALRILQRAVDIDVLFQCPGSDV